MPRLHQLLLYSAQQANILPVTSACNVSCLFCSHRQNPPEVKVYRIPPSSPDLIEELLDYIDGSKKIIIGESATKIIEGEPFTHPDFPAVLAAIRNRYPDTPVQITTNGTLLDEALVRELTKYLPCEINLSLNSASTLVRQKIMNDQKSQTAINCADLLARYGVTFHGSVVAMPHVTGCQDLEETIYFLAQKKARTIRVFMPGYTKLAGEENRFGPALWAELEERIIGIRKRISTPVTFEPRRLVSLTAEVEGVIPDSPAQKAGIMIGDHILKVNGRECFSRVDAFNSVFEAGDPVLQIARPGKSLELKLAKAPDTTSGLVFSYDLDPSFARDIPRLLRRHRSGKVLFLASELAGGIVTYALESIGCTARTEVLAVPNSYFGGSIMAAGLLTVSDFAGALDQYPEIRAVDLLVLPAVAFDDRGLDLTGTSYLEIEEKYGLPVVLN